jgi:hypothetical protein
MRDNRTVEAPSGPRGMPRGPFSIQPPAIQLSAVVTVNVAARHLRGLIVASDVHGERVVLQVGPENDALGERVDRRRARGVGGHCAARQVALDRIARVDLSGRCPVAIELRALGL